MGEGEGGERRRRGGGGEGGGGVSREGDRKEGKDE